MSARLGLVLIRSGRYAALVGGLAAGAYQVFNGWSRFVVLTCLGLMPGVIITGAGLILLARRGIYHGRAEELRRWNWLTWHG
jgi:hypothetical protein